MEKNVTINVVGVHMNVTDALQSAAKSAAKDIIKYCDDNSTITVTLRVVNKYSRCVEIMAMCDGKRMRVEKNNSGRFDDMYDVMAYAFDTMERNMIRYRDKKGAYRDRDSIRFVPDADETVENGPKIARVKSFSMKPMTPEEACLQMEMLGHDFFVFMNSETDTTCVVYRRSDDNYGLIKQ